MIWNPFKIIPQKKFLGTDIGTSSIKIVELSKKGNRIKLENYGELSNLTLSEKPFRTSNKDALFLSNRDIAQAIITILNEAKIFERRAVFSIPDFSSFFTNFELPPMTKEELPQAVKYEARQYVPIPLTEVTLDWRVIEGTASEKNRLKILLVAVPTTIINQYREIAFLSNLELQALEAEVFGLSRSLIRLEDKKVIAIIDIGAKSTTVNIIEQGILKMSHSFDIAGNELTQMIAKSLGIDYKEAEGLKQRYGLLAKEDENQKEQKNLSKFNPIVVREILIPLIDFIIIEIEKTAKNFYQSEGKEIQKIILAGGTSLLPGLKEYLAGKLKKEIAVANPFSDIIYPPILEKALKKMGPSYAIAVGMALRGLE